MLESRLVSVETYNIGVAGYSVIDFDTPKNNTRNNQRHFTTLTIAMDVISGSFENAKEKVLKSLTTKGMSAIEVVVEVKDLNNPKDNRYIMWKFKNYNNIDVHMESLAIFKDYLDDYPLECVYSFISAPNNIEINDVWVSDMLIPYGKELTRTETVSRSIEFYGDMSIMEHICSAEPDDFYIHVHRGIPAITNMMEDLNSAFECIKYTSHKLNDVVHITNSDDVVSIGNLDLGKVIEVYNALTPSVNEQAELYGEGSMVIYNHTGDIVYSGGLYPVDMELPETILGSQVYARMSLAYQICNVLNIPARGNYICMSDMCLSDVNMGNLRGLLPSDLYILF